MMHGQRFLMEAMGEPDGMSRSSMALCSAIAEDAEMACEFGFQARGSIELLSVMPGSPHAFAHRESPLSLRELTSLIA